MSGKDGSDKMEYCWLEEVPIEDPGPLEKERDFVKHIISVDDYALIEDSNTQNLYSVYYSNLITSRVSLEDYATLDDTVKAKCEFQTKTYIITTYVKNRLILYRVLKPKLNKSI